MTFRDFLQEEHDPNTVPVISGSPDAVDLLHTDHRDSLNLTLLDALDQPVITVESGYVKIQQILSDVGYDLIFSSAFLSDAEEGEDIYSMSDYGTLYLYVAFFQDDEGYYEFHAEVVTEDELNEILSIE